MTPGPLTVIHRNRVVPASAVTPHDQPRERHSQLIPTSTALKPKKPALEVAASHHASQLIERKPGNGRIGQLSSLHEGLQVLPHKPHHIVGPRLTRAIDTSMAP